jgi:mono/diheme cytochrome c family protein
MTRIAIAAALVGAIAVTTGSAARSQNNSQPGISGSLLFTRYCATCHGQSATGDGPLSANLRKRPANLTLLARSNGGVYSKEMVARIIDGRKPLGGHGGGDMPAWGDAFARSAEDSDNIAGRISALVDYLETIQQK